MGPPADCVMAVGQRAADGHMRGTPQQLRTQSDQAPPPADPRRARRRAGPARAGPRHRRRPIPPADLALPGLSRPLLARAQPLRAAPRRPALAGSSRGRPAPGAALLLRRARLPEADLRRAAARHRSPLRPAQRAPRRRPAPGRPRPGRRGGNQALGAAPHSHQRRHAPAARQVRDTPPGAGAARARGGRVGVAQGPPLRHHPGRPRAQRRRRSPARPRRRLVRRLAARPPRRGGGRPRPGRRLRRRRPARGAAGRPRRRSLAPAAQPRRGRAHRRGRPPRRGPARRARGRRAAGPSSHPGGAHHAAVRRAGREVAAQQARRATPEAPAPTTARKAARHQPRQARYAEVRRLSDAGATVSATARACGLDRKTVRKWLREGGPGTWDRPASAGILRPYQDHLERRWAEGSRNATRLWQELVGLGLEGGRSTVRAWATRRRRAAPDALDPTPAAATDGWKPPSTARVTRLIQADPSELPGPDRAFLDRLLVEAPALAEVRGLARDFAALVRKKGTGTLDEWLAAATGTPLGGFAEGLGKGLTAVRAALETRWSTGPVEGQISRLKTIKRTMYGRAGFELLRSRVLHAA